MRKNVNFPVTVSFRTTRSYKEELAKRAQESKKIGVRNAAGNP